jgi:DNA-binding transcriptional MocR family regulator
MTRQGSYRYQSIARSIAAQIEAGHFREGDRLPSVRGLMRHHDVSMSTASRVLVELEDQGYADSRERSGFYVRAQALTTAPSETTPLPTQTSPAPASVSLKTLIASLFKTTARGEVLSLGAAELAEELLPHRDLAASMIRVTRTSGAKGVLYGPPGGDPDLRRAIALMMGERGVVVPPTEVWITEGENAAMGAALRALTRPGDAVAVESPTYFGLLRWIEALGLKAVEIATDPVQGIDIGELARSMSALPIAAIAVNPTFHNPFGGTMPADHMRALVALADQYGVPVIEDDVYGDLRFGPRPIRPLRAHDPEGSVIYCSSFSKTLAPGYRVGWCLPGRWAEALAADRPAEDFGGAVLPQKALADYLKGRRYACHLDGLRTLFANQSDRFRALALEVFPEGTRVSAPQGGFVYWLEIPPPFDALTLHQKALADGIGLAPGPIFSATGRFANAFRLSLGRRLTPTVETAIRRLGTLAQTPQT